MSVALVVAGVEHGARLSTGHSGLAPQPLAQGLFGLLTLLPFFWSLLVLRSHEYALHLTQGGWVLFFVMLLVWCADSGAYFCWPNPVNTRCYQR